MALQFFSRFAVGAAALASLAAPAHAQSLSDKEGYDALLSCAAFFSAAAAITDGDKKTSGEATELATAFMTGAMLLAPGGNQDRAEKELQEQTEVFAVAMVADDKGMTQDLDELADGCSTLGENYLPEVIARAGE
ncbi:MULTISPECIES: hypothetical protein [Pseudomonadota]|jgi:hypothetical protein|uniref:hypothetical protein n=1 Tax=Pseudomonadota TaxID=1224 RepID=UPI00076A7FA7|nr:MULTISPECIES: hypothetical protein [Pseudomonadota]MAF61531.1 hypothetical protein [Blastomonas sp.]|tara:strand:+ start:4409 stop:4813 length:405 start_codon:yes stop_codon:yes gene_type:complete